MNNFTYDFMKLFLQEVRTVFRDQYVHLGMDEVYYDCWRSNPYIWQFMINNSFTDLSQVEQYYVERMTNHIKDIGFKHIVWQDPIDNGVQVYSWYILGSLRSNQTLFTLVVERHSGYGLEREVQTSRL